jgi:SAM-dependent methyltransferase
MPIELNYSTLPGQESMLQDSVRCKAFQRALSETVTPGCAVLDIGAGSGILSMFAAQAGARVVYAVEQTEIAKVARQIIEENGLKDQITVMQNDMAVLELPEKVDVIVSEWLGGYGVDENLLPIVVLARDRWLKPGGTMIPRSVTAFLAPAFDDFLQQDVDFWRSEPYGIDFDLISRANASKFLCTRNNVLQKHILSDPQVMWEVDAMTYSHEDSLKPFSCQLEFIADRDAEFNSLAAWFSAPLSEEVVLANGPSDPDTHWGRHVFPVGKIVSVTEGTRIAVDFCLEPQSRGASKATWEIDVDDYHFRSEGVTVLMDQDPISQPEDIEAS